MSGSQHNPNGRQSQLGSGWSPLQLQMANLLARAPQAHMSSERGVTWHTPTPPPHLYHVPAPSPPDPLQAMKSASGNSVFRHTATPPELYRHTPTPPDKHMIRHTPSPGDVKVAATMPPVDLYPHLGPTRDKLVTAEELLAYRRVGVDLSLGSRANGASPHLPPSPALSVRDAPTINSLIGRVAPRRVDSLLERLAPAPASPHSVIVHSRLAPTPSPPSSEDSADSCGAPPGSKRKRKPERVVRGPPPPDPPRHENGTRDPPAPPHPLDTTRRKTRSGSAETIADIAAMIAEGGEAEPPTLSPVPAPTADKLAPAPDAAPAPAPPPAPAPSPPPPPQTLAPTPSEAPAAPAPSPPPAPAPTIVPTPVIPAETEAEKDKDRSQVVSGVETAAAPRRRSARTSNSEATNVPVESPSEGKPAETESAAPASAQPAAASFVEVENQLEKMFAGLEEEPRADSAAAPAPRAHAHKRRRSAPARGRRHARRARAPAPPAPSAPPAPAAPPRPRGPYIQVRGPASSPASVCVMNAATGEEEEAGRRRGEERRRGLHASTLGLRYDAATRDHTWVCAFCGHQPHHAALGDLFGPYAGDDGAELWLHAECGVWASGVVASGARVWGLARAAAGARRARCRECARAPAALACGARACASTAHLHCARAAGWLLLEDDFRALCPLHAPAPAPSPAPLAAP